VLKKGGKALSISDTPAPQCCGEIITGTTINSLVIQQLRLGNTQTGVLVGGRYQVKVISVLPSLPRAIAKLDGKI